MNASNTCKFHVVEFFAFKCIKTLPKKIYKIIASKHIAEKAYLKLQYLQIFMKHNDLVKKINITHKNIFYLKF